MTTQQSSAGMAEPPEGAIVGENVHPDSEPDEYDEAAIKTVMGELKARDEMFQEMRESKLREYAKDFLRKHGVDL